jgi:hypothetical protein
MIGVHTIPADAVLIEGRYVSLRRLSHRQCKKIDWSNVDFRGADLRHWYPTEPSAKAALANEISRRMCAASYLSIRAQQARRAQQKPQVELQPKPKAAPKPRPVNTLDRLLPLLRIPPGIAIDHHSIRTYYRTRAHALELTCQSDALERLNAAFLPWMQKQLFHLLALPAGADAETVKQAYRERMRTAHPDAGTDQEELAKELADLYATWTKLRSPEP